jgi:hypothetical protein
MSLPLTLDAKGLAALLHKKESTILWDVSHNPERLPPFTKKRKKPIWFSAVVLNWLAGKPNNELVEICLTRTTIDATGLAAILYQKESTIKRDVSRDPTCLPPILKQVKKPFWLLLAALKWIADKSNKPINIVFTETTNRPAIPSIAEMLLKARG